MPKDAEAADVDEKVMDNQQDAEATAENAGADAKTIGEGAEGEGKEAVAPIWPDDWRKKIAGDDEKALSKITRLQSPADVWKSYRAMEQRLSEAKLPLPENPTDEQVAEYRKANGIPAEPKGYLDAAEGLVIGDDDRPLVDDFLGKMHERNASPEAVSEALSWYYGAREKQMAELSEGDKAYRRESEDALRGEWGGEYRANLNSLAALESVAPPGVIDEIMGSRGADNRLLGDNPEILKWLVSVSNDLNPAGTVVPGDGTSQVDSVQSEIAKIEKVMREDRKAYNADTRMQARLRQLYDAEEKLKKRG